MSQEIDGDCKNATIDRLLSMHTVSKLTTYSRPSIYRLIAAGQFPRPLKLGDQRIAFRESEIIDWLDSRTRALGNRIKDNGEPKP